MTAGGNNTAQKSVETVLTNGLQKMTLHTNVFDIKIMLSSSGTITNITEDS